MTTVVLCEKYSQAKAICEAMKLSGMSGSWKGIRLSITWASGHLLEYEPPDTASPNANWYDPASLIPLPDSPRMQPSKDSSKRLASIKAALSKADTVWLATDPDREGEAIGREILVHLHYRGPLKRLWLNGGMDSPSILKALGSLRADSDSIGLWRAQQARSRADYSYMYLTRAATACARAGGLGDNLGTGKARASVASIGRVQTPTLRLIVEREKAIANFVPITHYIPQISIPTEGRDAVFTYAPVVTEEMTQQAWPGIEWRPREKGLDRPLFTDHKKADTLRRAVQEIGQTEIGVQHKQIVKQPPRCYALIDLQKAASKALKLGASQTLSTAQKLYTEGYISYPRTEHQELPLSAYVDAPGVLKALCDYPFDPASTALKRTNEQRKSNAKPPRAYRDKSMEHHGLMPTTTVPDPGKLSRTEKVIYEMIAKRYIQAHFPEAKGVNITAIASAEATGVFGECPVRYMASKEAITEPGWMIAFDNKTSFKKPDVYYLKDGDYPIDDSWLDEKMTRPPEPFTEDTLLAAMKNAARFVQGDDATTLRNANGLGTPATRGSIIDTLLTREYVTRKKGGRLSAQSKGFDLIEHLPGRLSNVALTAAWELTLSEIETDRHHAEQKRDVFIAEQTAHITMLIKRINEQMPPPDKRRRYSGGHGKKKRKDNSRGKPTEKMLAYAELLARRNSVTMTDKVRADFGACSQFIEAHK